MRVLLRKPACKRHFQVSECTQIQTAHGSSSPVSHPDMTGSLGKSPGLLVGQRRFLKASISVDGPRRVRAAEQPSRPAQTLALPAFHCSHGTFQSPSPSVPGSVEPTVLTTSTMSPRLVLS